MSFFSILLFSSVTWTTWLVFRCIFIQYISYMCNCKVEREFSSFVYTQSGTNNKAKVCITVGVLQTIENLLMKVVPTFFLLLLLCTWGKYFFFSLSLFLSFHTHFWFVSIWTSFLSGRGDGKKKKKKEIHWWNSQVFTYTCSILWTYSCTLWQYNKEFIDHTRRMYVRKMLTEKKKIQFAYF